MLVELLSSRAVMLHNSPDSLDGVRELDYRIEVLPKKAAPYFCCKGSDVLLSTEGAFRVSIDCYDATWSRHLELEISIVWHRVESSKCDLSELRKGTISKINSSLRKLSGDPKTTSNVIEPARRAATPGITPLKVVLVGLILDGSMLILRTVS